MCTLVLFQPAVCARYFYHTFPSILISNLCFRSLLQRWSLPLARGGRGGPGTPRRAVGADSAPGPVRAPQRYASSWDRIFAFGPLADTTPSIARGSDSKVPRPKPRDAPPVAGPAPLTLAELWRWLRPDAWLLAGAVAAAIAVAICNVQIPAALGVVSFIQ